MQRILVVVVGLGIAIALTSSATTARGNMLTINPTADATITDTTGDGTFDTVSGDGFYNSVRDFPNIAIDRSVIEYSLTALPTNATINSVTFEFGTFSFISSSANVDILGYLGDCATTVSDATAAATLLQSFDAASLGTGSHSVNLGATAATLLQSILGSVDFVGLRLQDTTSTAFPVRVPIAASSLDSSTTVQLLCGSPSRNEATTAPDRLNVWITPPLTEAVETSPPRVFSTR